MVFKLVYIFLSFTIEGEKSLHADVFKWGKKLFGNKECAVKNTENRAIFALRNVPYQLLNQSCKV